MASSKLYFVALLIIASVFIDVQSTRKFNFFPLSILLKPFVLHISKKLKIMTYHVYIIYIFVVANSEIMDAWSDCDFRGPCKKKEDCYDRCEVDRPPFNNAICVPFGRSRQCCCILS